MQYTRGGDEGCSFILTSFSIWAPTLQPWGGLKLTGIHAIILLLVTGCQAAHMPKNAAGGANGRYGAVLSWQPGTDWQPLTVYPPRCRGGICGRGATVAHQPSKLRTRVRFPSSAPDQTVGNQLHSFGRCSGRLRHATSARRDDVLRLPGCKLGHNLVLENDQ